MVPVEENRILKNAIRGDSVCLEYLVNTYKDMAYTIAMKIVYNNEDAEEVVQDSFVKAFASLGNFREASKFSTWLYRIVYNTAITKSTSKKRISILSPEMVEDHLGVSGETMGWELLLKKDRKKFINLALDKLNAEDRLIVILYYIAEKGISEIGKIINMKNSAIKMRLLRARKQLQVELQLLLGKEIKDFYEQ